MGHMAHPFLRPESTAACLAFLRDDCAESTKSIEMGHTQRLPPYALSEDTFLCIHGVDAVFLTLKSGRYLAFEDSQHSGLDRLIHGWPLCSSSSDDAEPLTEAAAPDSVQALLDAGLITPNPSSIAPHIPALIPKTTDEWTADTIAGRPRMGSRAYFGILRAVLAARLALKYRSLAQITLALRRRKTTLAAQVQCDVNRTAHLSLVFDYLRPYVLSAVNACLLDSITLLNFLALYQIYPDLVFGVRTRPFIAHCWVQYNHIVLNDTVERVCRFTPILSI